MALAKIKEIYLSYGGNKIVSSKELINFIKYMYSDRTEKLGNRTRMFHYIVFSKTRKKCVVAMK